MVELLRERDCEWLPKVFRREHVTFGMACEGRIPDTSEREGVETPHVVLG